MKLGYEQLSNMESLLLRDIFFHDRDSSFSEILVFSFYRERVFMKDFDYKGFLRSETEKKTIAFLRLCGISLQLCLACRDAPETQ